MDGWIGLACERIQGIWSKRLPTNESEMGNDRMLIANRGRVACCFHTNFCARLWPFGATNHVQQHKCVPVVTRNARYFNAWQASYFAVILLVYFRYAMTISQHHGCQFSCHKATLFIMKDLTVKTTKYQTNLVFLTF